MNSIETVCPGCGLGLPKREQARYDGGFNTSPECWEVFTEVLGKEFSNAVLFGQVHQLTVDAYAAQHAGGNHRDKSVVIHLCGLHFVLDRGLRPTAVAPLLQRLAESVKTWPHFGPPVAPWAMTIFDVGITESVPDHTRMVRAWAASVWQAWKEHHEQIKNLVVQHLDSNEQRETRMTNGK